MTPAPHIRLFSFYGDDFTGSTDVLEGLAGNGLDTVLFLRPPTASNLSAFPHCRAFGIAGESRSRSPEWMRTNLPPIFENLRQIGTPIVQYKVCSTFDSSPETGSIGCALEIGQDIFGTPQVPVVAAAPILRRYVVFGHLFAAEGERIYRIDRHPAMKQHPVTPMRESDLLVHLGRQTTRSLALMDWTALGSRHAGARFSELLQEHPGAVVFDGLDESMLVRAARLIWHNSHPPQTFVIGSSGFTHAMATYWRQRGWIGEPKSDSGAPAVDRLLVLSGSCSPATHRQICQALRNGFAGIALDPARCQSAFDVSTASRATAELASGKSVILYSALGPGDRKPAVDRASLARQMGRLLRQVTRQSQVSRILIAGGDTASHAVRELGIEALTFAASTVPGVPLCLAHSSAPEWHGLELVLKGGQIGPDTFFEDTLRGIWPAGPRATESNSPWP